MYTRDLKVPRRAFFLFGPRATGKSTWLRAAFPEGLRLDLLPPETALVYAKTPSLLRHEVLAQPRNTWIIVDEIQKVPALLDEVHFLMESHGYKRFALSGSSSRKIKRGAANLLAGRAVMRRLHPLTTHEIGHDVSARQAMTFGMLPMSITAPDDAEREDYLKAYVDAYLREEIKYEGLVRDVGAFGRFLDVAALMAGQRVNAAALARNAGVARDTVRGYLSIFEDTLLGCWLPAYRPRARVKEVAAPKLYWFDSGVLHAAAGGFQQPLPSEWDDVLLEHWIHHEIRAFMDYSGVRGSLCYWRTPTGSEIDFLWWFGSRAVAIEVKASTRHRAEFTKGIESFREGHRLHSSWVVYLGEKTLRVGETTVLPVMEFLRRLHEGDVIE